MTPGEIELAKSVYQNANIDYSKVRVVYEKAAFFQEAGREMSPNGSIYTGGPEISDYSVQGVLNNQYFLERKTTFIHEMAHVWQFQRGNNLVLQGIYRMYDYSYNNLEKLPFGSYGIEQQATIIQDYFILKSGYHMLGQPGMDVYRGVIPFLSK